MNWSLLIVQCPRCKIRNNVRYYNPLKNRLKCGNCRSCLDEKDRNRMEQLFNLVHDELDLLERKIEKKESLLGIEWHKYKTSYLMESEHLNRIYSIAKKHDILVIEDATSALGAMYEDNMVGS